MVKKYSEFISENKNDINEEFIEACKTGNLEKFEELIKNPNVNLAYIGNKGLRRACENGHLHILNRLLELSKTDKRINPADFNNLGIYWACANGHLHILNRLLELSKSDKRINPAADDNACLRDACNFGHIDILNRLLEESKIDKRINPAARDNYAIKYACNHRYIDIVKILLLFIDEELNEELIDLLIINILKKVSPLFRVILENIHEQEKILLFHIKAYISHNIPDEFIKDIEINNNPFKEFIVDLMFEENDYNINASKIKKYYDVNFKKKLI